MQNEGQASRSQALGQICILDDRVVGLAHYILLRSPRSIKATDHPAVPVLLRLKKYVDDINDNYGTSPFGQHFAMALQAALSESAIDQLVVKFRVPVGSLGDLGDRFARVPTRGDFEKDWNERHELFGIHLLPGALSVLQRVRMSHVIPWTTVNPRTKDLEWSQDGVFGLNHRNAVVDLLQGVERTVASVTSDMIARWRRIADPSGREHTPARLDRVQAFIQEEAGALLEVFGRMVPKSNASLHGQITAVEEPDTNWVVDFLDHHVAEMDLVVPEPMASQIDDLGFPAAQQIAYLLRTRIIEIRECPIPIFSESGVLTHGAYVSGSIAFLSRGIVILPICAREPLLSVVHECTHAVGELTELATGNPVSVQQSEVNASRNMYLARLAQKRPEFSELSPGAFEDNAEPGGAQRSLLGISKDHYTIETDLSILQRAQRLFSAGYSRSKSFADALRPMSPEQARDHLEGFLIEGYSFLW